VRDVLVVDVDPLEPVDLLDLVDQIRVQRLLAEHREEAVRLLGSSMSGSPWTLTCTPRGTEYSLRSSPSAGTMMIFRWPLTMPPWRTTP
jgi:hypothetical protein